ncbi:maleylpyruvate isomerase N-terminal domain-containing protein [Phycicoccus sp.]|uniref:maleylpyruvate isomerase N-terminal domain-containing protein n=1 Tax=Phycicoccus sp. TaxID=1902410 RepID=UPI002C26EE12|nr:maleylpyruvate isomerase N-terminal domain-containing protein [Phycicoccus sp.]HMM95942.1 maleylpyruvate isomerase N-terminal domain-containing protein [Phycicoccus sp.]
MLTVPHDLGLAAFAASVDAFTDAVRDLDELALLGPSRCHGWSRLDVVSHVLAGWQELLGGLATRTDASPTVDAASYWRAFAEGAKDSDPIALLMAQRRRTDAWHRPSSGVAELADVADVVRGAVRYLPAGQHAFQGHVLTSGDLLATWAVESAVHHLDLLVTSDPPAPALALTRRTAACLLDEELPTDWDDTTAALVATGRVDPPENSSHLAGRLPAFG